LHSIVNYLLKLCFEIFLRNRYYIQIPYIIAPCWNCFYKHSRYHMTLAYSSCLINLRNQRLVVRRRPTGPPHTASRGYIWAYLLNWWLVSIWIWPASGLVSGNDKVSLRMIQDINLNSTRKIRVAEGVKTIFPCRKSVLRGSAHRVKDKTF
jgi:hypothetical protein